jgi:hypothetical protein
MENDSKSTLRQTFVAPDGTAAIATNVNVSITDFDAIKTFVLAERWKWLL